MTQSTGYYDSPWPGEDGCPARTQTPRSSVALQLQPNETLKCVTRNVFMGTMTVLRDPGEVYFLSHQMIRHRYFGLPTTSRVERIDPLTLRPLYRSPRLPAGPAWPGGVAVHANGDLYVVYGRWCHRLNPECELIKSYRLPQDRAYNSFVILDNGVLVMKDYSDTFNARLTFLDPESLQPVCDHFECPEPSIARLSSRECTTYVVGTRSIFRVTLNDGVAATLDESWKFDYVGTGTQTYGWDVVLSGGHAWFMDNGKHRYFNKMIGRGVNDTPLNLIRVSLRNADDHVVTPISGIDGGSITNPPLYDANRRIAVGYDSANAFVQAWRNTDAGLEPLWHKVKMGVASHMLLFAETGELLMNDFQSNSEYVVVLDIETGREISRVHTGGFTQGVLFPSPGWDRDFYWATPGRLARVYVE